jgi:hypothetical protein
LDYDLLEYLSLRSAFSVVRAVSGSL